MTTQGATMNIPEEAIEKAARVIHDDQWAGDDWEGHTESARDGWRNLARAALSAAAPTLMAMARELAPGEMATLPDGSIVIDRHGNPGRIEDRHWGMAITRDDLPFRVVYIPEDET